MIRINTKKMYDNEYAETGESEMTTNFLVELVGIGVEFQTLNEDEEYIYVFEIAEQFNENEGDCVLAVLSDDSELYLTSEELKRSEYGISQMEKHYGFNMEYEIIK